MSHASDERAHLADALTEAGPDAPTLCDGWTARDLAAHLVVRERRPDAGPGVVLAPLAPWTERVRRGYADRPFDELVASFRSGPPLFAWTALPGVDGAVNLVEHFVHCEDVRRAGPAWEPRGLPADLERALWRQLTTMARLRYRGSPVGVALVVPGGERHVARRGPDELTLTGLASELVLHAFGRREHARVSVDGG